MPGSAHAEEVMQLLQLVRSLQVHPNLPEYQRELFVFSFFLVVYLILSFLVFETYGSPEGKLVVLSLKSKNIVITSTKPEILLDKLG